MSVPDLDDLRRAGVLSPLDVYVARTLARLGNEQRADVTLATALASRAVREGDVCLDLARLAGTSVAALVDDSEPRVTGRWPSRDRWLERVRSSPLVGDADGTTPLVLDVAGRLYLRRYWEHQARLAAAIRARATCATVPDDPAALRGALDRLFPGGGPPRAAGEPDWQRVAAAVAALRAFCVISGGPGTGKTFTVVKVLALLIEQARQAGRPLPRITLLAPTGKAAARLSETIRATKVKLECEPAVRDAIPEAAATIHRGLGSIGGRATRFRHNADNPLLADVVLVDEASMVDLALMARLVDAMPAAARLILLGDKDQLSSVEAGAVLGDICNTGRPRSYSSAFAARLSAVVGEAVPPGADPPGTAGIWDCIVQLQHSYRYRADSGIGALARAINAGDAEAVETILGSDDDDVGRVEPADTGGLGRELTAAVCAGFRAYAQERAPAARLRAFEQFRVLCAHRRGWRGVETVNPQIEAELARAGLLDVRGTVYAGRPVMVTRNDYALKLFNGDVGLLLEEPGGDGRTMAFFVAPDGAARCLAPARLPPHETVFAMSVHKSQGSEFDAVAVLLPDTVSPVLTRELLYTAVTRARRRVRIHGTAAVIREAVRRSVERASGLRDLLWG